MTRPDEVDRIAAAWQREQPDLDLAPLHVLSRVTRLARHLDRVRRASFGAHDLEAGEFDVLAALRRSGPPYQASPGRLSTETMVTSGTMTARLDKLESRGLVHRRTDPADGRAVIVALTDQGRDLVGAAVAALVAAESELLTDLADDDRAALADLLRRVLAPLDTGAHPPPR